MSGGMSQRRFVASVCIATVVFLFGQTEAASPALVAHEATYKVRISILSGTLRTVVTATEHGFVSQSTVTPTGLAKILINGSIEESATFTVGNNGIRPDKYESSNTLAKDDKFMVFDFDWDQNAASGTINGETYVFELESGVRDRVSIQYELMYNLINGIDNRDYVLLDGDELKLLQVTNIGKKTIKTPFGNFEAIGIQYRARNSTRVSTLWCAEDLGYLPVLIEQHRKGKRRVRAVLVDYVPAAD